MADEVSQDELLNPDSLGKEIQIMSMIAKSLDEDDDSIRVRVLDWLCNRYKHAGVQPVGASFEPTGSNESVPRKEPDMQEEFPDLAAFFSTMEPKANSEKALVAAYWIQHIEGNSEFGTQLVNDSLKNLGEGVQNISDAFSTLLTKKNVMQIKKTGKGPKSRKIYKLAAQGQKEIATILRAKQSGDK